MKFHPHIFLPFLTAAIAREITFPPVAGIKRYNTQSPLQRYGSASDEDVSLETDPMDGLTSFAHLPHVSCFSAAADVESYDIAVIGAPFDTGTSYRPGARFGPHGIRDGSRRIRPLHSWNMYTGYNPFLQWAKAVDCGDAPLTFVDNTVAMKQLEKAHKVGTFSLETKPLPTKTLIFFSWLDHIQSPCDKYFGFRSSSNPYARGRSYSNPCCLAFNNQPLGYCKRYPLRFSY